MSVVRYQLPKAKCRSQDLVGQCCRVGLAGVGQVATVAVLGFVLLTAVSNWLLVDAS